MNVSAISIGGQPASPAKAPDDAAAHGVCWFVAFELLLFAPFKFLPVGILGYPTYPEKFVNWAIRARSRT